MKRNTIGKTIILGLCLFLIGVEGISCSENSSNIDEGDYNFIVPDDFNTIQEAINSAEDGYRIFVRNGIYTENIDINDVSVYIEGESWDNTRIISGGVNDYTIEISYSNITLNNLCVCNNDKRDGIYVTSNDPFASNAEINHCRIIDNLNYQPNTDVNGIFAVDVDGLKIINCEIENNGNNGVYVYGDKRMYNINISTCEIKNNGKTESAGKGIFIYSNSKEIQENISIWNCSIKDNGLDGIRIQNTNDVIIDKCSINNNPFGIRLSHNSDNNTIRNCNEKRKINNSIYDGIVIEENSDNNTILNCRISSNSHDGIYIDESNNCKMINCRILTNGWNGIHLTESSNENEILSCNINYSKGSDYDKANGILIEKLSSHNNIIRCIITNNNCGIRIISSNSNMISQSVFKNNSLYNIDIINDFLLEIFTNSYSLKDLFGGIRDFIIEGNYIENIGEKIYYMKQGNNNKIFRNSFFPSDDNSRYARDKCKNYWNYNDTTKYSHGPYYNKNVGNYWYDFAQQAVDDDNDDIIDGYYYVDGLFPILSSRDINKTPLPSFENFDMRPLKHNPQLLDWISPDIAVVYPNCNEHLFGTIDIIWSAYDPTSNLCNQNSNIDELNFSIEIQKKTSGIWNDWKLVEEDLHFNDSSLTNNEFIYKLNTLEYSDGAYRLRINATDNSSEKNTGSKISYLFIINNNGPCVSRVTIVNNDIGSREFVKSGDSVSIVAEIFYEDVKNDDLDIYADLTAFGKNSQVPYNYTNNQSYIWIIKKDDWKSSGNGILEIPVNAQIKKNTEYNDTNYGYIILDNNKPNISINKPVSGIYFFNNARIFPTLMKILPFSIVFGPISVNIDTSDNFGVPMIKWTVDGIPYKEVENRNEWLYLGNIGRHTIKATIYDNAYNFRSSRIELIVLGLID